MGFYLKFVCLQCAVCTHQHQPRRAGFVTVQILVTVKSVRIYILPPENASVTWGDVKVATLAAVADWISSNFLLTSGKASAITISSSIKVLCSFGLPQIDQINTTNISLAEFECAARIDAVTSAPKKKVGNHRDSFLEALSKRWWYQCLKTKRVRILDCCFIEMWSNEISPCPSFTEVFNWDSRFSVEFYILVKNKCQYKLIAQHFLPNFVRC